MHDSKNTKCERNTCTDSINGCKDCACTCSSVEEYRIEERGGTMILVMKLGCRPATDAEIYFNRLLLSARTEVLTSLLEKLPKVEDCKTYGSSEPRESGHTDGFATYRSSVTDIIKGMMNEK